MSKVFRRRFSFVAVVFVCALLGVLSNGRRAEVSSTEPVLLPPVTATETVSITNDGVPLGDGVDGRADPGEILEYTVTVTNGGSAATGVELNSILQAQTTFVGGSVAISPAAGNDTLPVTVTGNVAINTALMAVPFSVVANDFTGNNVTPGLTISAFDATTTQGGQVVMTTSGAGIGRFTYDPPAGFEGSDTFTYTLSDNTNAPSPATNRTATVSITVSGMVWFINNNAAVCTTNGCGRLSNPYSTLAAFNTANDGVGNHPNNNDSIFIYESATAYTGGISLRSGQKLIGQDSTSTLSSLTGLSPVTGSTAFPAMNTGAPATTIQNAGGNGVSLLGNSTLSGFTAGNASGSALSSGAIGTLTVSDVIINTTGQAMSLTSGAFAGTGFISTTSGGGSTNVNLGTITGTVNLGSGALTGASANAVNVVAGSPSVNYSGTISGAGSYPVRFFNTTGGNSTFSGAISGTGLGISLDTNPGATFNFIGGINLNTTANAAFTAVGGGTVNVTQNNTSIVNTISTTTATTLTVTNTTIGASGLTFRSISANGAANGINLDTTGTSGGLTVTGNSAGLCGGSTVVNTSYAPGTAGSVPYTFTAVNNADCTGGTIQNTTGDAVSLTSTANVSLTRMRITSVGTAGNQVDGAKGIEAVNLGGSNAFRNGQITATGQGGGTDRNAIDVRNTNTNMTLLSIENSYFANARSGTSNIFSSARGTSNMGFTVTNSMFENIEALAVQSNAGDTEDAVHTVTTNFTGNVFRNAPTPVAGGGSQGSIAVTIAEQLATHNFTVSNNVFHDLIKGIAGGNSELVAFQTTGGSLAGTFSGNVVGGPDVSGISGANGDRRGIGIIAEPDVSVNGEVGSFDIIIENNKIDRLVGREGIFVDVREDTTNSELIIRNNLIGTLNGFLGQVGGSGASDREAVDVQHRGETNKTLNMLMTGNTIRSTTTTPTGNINLETNNDSTATGALLSFQATVTSNNLINTGGMPELTARTRSGDTGGSVCLDMTGNALDSGAGQIQLWEDGGPLNVEQASQAALGTANGIPSGNVLVSNTPNYGTACAAPPTISVPLEENASARIEASRANVEMASALIEMAYANVETPSSFFETQTANVAEPSSNIAKSPANADIRPATVDITSAVVAIVSPDRAMASSDSAIASADSAIASPASAEPSAFGAIVSAIGNMISPTVYSQEVKFDVKNSASPLSGETITTTPTFTIPASKNIVIKYRAMVDSGPYPAGVNNIDNFATVSGTNPFSVNSNTVSVPLDAAPDLSTLTSDFGVTTQPGGTVSYNIQYQNGNAANGQGATGVTLGATVPANTTFNSGTSSAGWTCLPNNNAGSACTIAIGGVAPAVASSRIFAVNVAQGLSSGTVQISVTGTVSDDGTNGTDPNPVDNTEGETTNIIGNWDGSSSTDWHTTANWSNDIVPPAGNNISISAGGNVPKIVLSDVSTGTVTLTNQNVEVDVGRTLTANTAVALGTSAVVGSGTLYLPGPATVSRTTGLVTASLRKDFAVSLAPQAVFVFPVGSATAYTPVTANVTAGTGSLTVLANDGTAPSVPPLPNATTLNRYWQLTEAGSLTADLTFEYVQTQVDGVEANYRMIRTATGAVPRSFANGAPCPGAGNPCVDAAANTIFAAGVQVFDNFWTAGEALAPTAANVGISGRVLDEEGRGLARARIQMTDTSGNVIYAITNPFGYYRFVGVPAGQDYVMSVDHKHYTFDPRVVSVKDELTEVDFVPTRK